MVLTIVMTIATIGRVTKRLGTVSYWAPGCAELDATVFSGGGVHGLAVTGAPALIFCRPSTTTFSPGFNPVVITQSGPTRSPTWTGRISAFPSAPITPTW